MKQAPTGPSLGMESHVHPPDSGGHAVRPGTGPSMGPFRVTREWIFRHRTIKGAWRREQLESLGIQWPPRQGWVVRSEGKLITNQQWLTFEQCKNPGQQLDLAFVAVNCEAAAETGEARSGR